MENIDLIKALVINIKRNLDGNFIESAQDSADQLYDLLIEKGRSGENVGVENVVSAAGRDGFCEWTLYDEENNLWETECDEISQIMDGTPKENTMRFCCYCGKKIVGGKQD